jgi:DNA gyrase/topoisomerase IV subunit B
MQKDVKILSDIDHILQRPETYIGDSHMTQDFVILYNQ